MRPGLFIQSGKIRVSPHVSLRNHSVKEKEQGKTVNIGKRLKPVGTENGNCKHTRKKPKRQLFRQNTVDKVTSCQRTCYALSLPRIQRLHKNTEEKFSVGDTPDHIQLQNPF